jgi:hypothetical protein
VPNNIVRPTYLDLITNRFIATSLRLVSAEKFDLDPSAEKSYCVCLGSGLRCVDWVCCVDGVLCGWLVYGLEEGL